MANPGPAVTNTNHPSNLATNQALRLLASAQSVNLNAVGDTVATLLNDSGNVSVQSIIVANASISLTTAELAVTQAQAQLAQQSKLLTHFRVIPQAPKWS